MKILTAIWVGSFTIFISGCAVKPQVTYTTIRQTENIPDNLTDSFFLQSSTIDIVKNGSKKDKDGNEIDLIEIKSTPVEFPLIKIGISAKSSWWGSVKTIINIDKRENTSLVKKIGTKIKDSRVDTIKTIGTIVTTVVPFIAFSDDKDVLNENKLPWSRTVYKAFSENNSNVINWEDSVSIELGQLSPTARPISLIPVNKKTSVFIYSACRDALIKFKYQQKINGQDVISEINKTIKIADPRYFEVVDFPVQGTITTHSECGVSVQNDTDASVSSGADIINALATQGKSIKEAIDAAKK